MIKFKKIYCLVFLFVFFLSCGYTPIFSKKDVNFSIENIELIGDRNIGKKISIELSPYKKISDKKKKITLVILNSKSLTVASKNAKGEAQTGKLSIDTKVKINEDENNFFEKYLKKSSTYSIIDRKSEQKLIEDKLIDNLSAEIAREIIFEILRRTN